MAERGRHCPPTGNDRSFAFRD